MGVVGGDSASDARRAVVVASQEPPGQRPHAEPDGSRASAGPAPRDQAPFDVVLTRSGVTLTVPPGRSILSVVRAAGIRALASCTEGVCGTCETSVLGGRPEHRDSLLTEAERAASATMLICVSRCDEGPLILDL